MRKDLWTLFNPIWILTIILLLVIAASYLVTAETFNSQGVPIDANGNIDWNYLNSHGTSTTGSGVGKFILDIPQCYNATIAVTQQTGNTTVPTFDGCTQTKDNTHWYCDCHNTGTDFNITMHTADAQLSESDARWYEIDISYTQYQLNTSIAQLHVEDWGNQALAHGTPEHMGGCSDVVYLPQIQYVNVTTPGKTIYVDRNITIDHNITIENTAKIKELSSNLTTCQANSDGKDVSIKHYRSESGWLIFVLVLVVVGVGMLFYYGRRRE